MKNLSNFGKLLYTQAIVFLFIPLILILVNDGVVLKSISAYAKYTPMTFSSLLSLASAIFIYDGILEHKSRWYNIYIGLSLLGVVYFDMYNHFIIHYIFAGIFFLGSLFNMVYFSSKKQRFIKLLVAFIVLLGMSGHYIFNLYSLFWAEWFAMIPMSIHYILELTNKID